MQFSKEQSIVVMPSIFRLSHSLVNFNLAANVLYI